MASSLRRHLIRFSPIATIIALSFACGSEGGTGAGSGGAQGPTGGASTTGGAANTGGMPNATGGNPNPSGGSLGTGGDSTDSGGAPNTGGDASDSGGGSGTGGEGNDSGADCSPREGDVPVLKLTQIADDLDGPVFITSPPGDSDRLFVITLTGTVRIIKEGALVSTPFLDLGNRVAVGGERGLLGIAFHPEFATNRLLYLHFSAGQGVDGATTGDTVIEEYRASEDDPDVAEEGYRRTVLTVDQPAGNHNGGAINFGPDGYLYIGLGDGGSANDPSGNGQNVSVLLAKILRIDPTEDGDSPYTSPPGNLKDEVSEAAPEIWDYGLRNPFRFTFDMCTGDLYIGDVGQNTYEEIDIELAGEGHKNYGWNTMEGLHCFSPMTNCDQDGLTLPYIEVPDTQGTSITGGAVYRGSAIPGLRGAYFYADYVSNRVWYTFFDRDAEEVSTPVSLTQDLNPVSIVAITNGHDGELYFTSLGPIQGSNVGPGAIYKLEVAE